MPDMRPGAGRKLLGQRYAPLNDVIARVAMICAPVMM
jgi:hypothetical protein